ncbi:MAG: hypothetical protein HZB95_08145 [Nitrosomonadales bacterium]|nr:hypothetical protein [Nitrosomonadales bacterium]
MRKHIVMLLPLFGILLMLGLSLSACAGLLGFGGDNWKEEVLLHDGSKIIAERTAKRGGRHEIGQKPPFESQQLEFVMPVTGERVIWVDNYSEDIGTASFLPMLLDIRQGVAYLVANNMGCLSYNKWGRPNPPYVVFKYEGKEWKRIPVQELPAEINRPNLIQSEPDATAERIRKSPVPAERIQEIISNYRQPEFRTILREPLAKGRGCPIPTNARAEPVGPVINGEILLYNWRQLLGTAKLKGSASH